MALTTKSISGRPQPDESAKDYEIRRDPDGKLYCYSLKKDKPTVQIVPEGEELEPEVIKKPKRKKK